MHTTLTITITLILICVLLVSILIALIRLYHFIRPDDLKAGDIVIITNPHCEEMMMNMVTEVMDVFSASTVQVRGIRTTVTMHRRWVHRIDVQKGSSIKVPEKPVAGSLNAGNRANFREIPLKWFSYDNPSETA